MKSMVLVAIVLFVLTGTSRAFAQVSDLQAAQIEANVPAPGEFDTLLIRDLATFFSARGLANPEVSFVLLRDGPTQSGVSWPKYYAWVSVSADGALSVTGAVRVAAVGRVRFEVTDFLSRDEILADPDRADAVFPAALAPLVQQRASGY